jgi:hypothetical protein
MNNAEKKIVSGIVNRALAKGYELTVLADGEEPAEVEDSNNAVEVLNSMAAADTDLLIVTSHSGTRHVGFIHFVYGNDEGEDVVCDHSDNPAINEIVGC